MANEIPRIVTKLGGSWVVKLDPDTRKLLGIKEIGETIILKRGEPLNVGDTTEEEHIEDYS